MAPINGISGGEAAEQERFMAQPWQMQTYINLQPSRESGSPDSGMED